MSAYAAIYLLWGSSYLAVRVVVGYVPPFLAAGIRYFIAGALLLLISAVKGDAWPSRREILHSCASGAMLLTILYGAVFWAETMLSSWLVAVLMATVPLWTYLGESLVLHSTRPSGKMLLSVLAGLLGTIALAGSSIPSKDQQAPQATLAIAAVLVGAVSWSAGSLALKRMALPSSATLASGIQLASSGLCLLLFSVLTSKDFAALEPARLIDPHFVSAMAFLILGPSLLAFTAFSWLMRSEPASRVMISAYVNPVVAMLLGILLTNEACSLRQLAGAVAILGSTFCIWHFSKFQRGGAHDEAAVDAAACTSS